jgi:hypothetical protein
MRKSSSAGPLILFFNADVKDVVALLPSATNSAVPGTVQAPYAPVNH